MATPPPASGYPASDYPDTPTTIVSPTDSIAYSDSAQLDSGFPFDSVYASTEDLYAQSRWYSQEYSVDDPLQSPTYDPSRVPVFPQPTSSLNDWSDTSVIQTPPSWTTDDPQPPEPQLHRQQQQDAAFAPGQHSRENSTSSSSSTSSSTSADEPEQRHKSLPNTTTTTPPLPTPSRPSPSLPTPPVKRPRGRPRIIRPDSTNDAAKTHKPARVSKRLPHNQVERKYREHLNAEMERLRATIPPLLPGSQSGGSCKPSKTEVLHTAVDEIERSRGVIARLEGDCARLMTQVEAERERGEMERMRLEMERDRWRLEAEALRLPIGKI